jgi:hypothetical protein
MNKYDFAEYFWKGSNIICFRCTDSLEIDSLFTFLEQFKNPRAGSISRFIEYYENSYSGKCGADLIDSYLTIRYLDVNWVVFKFLCSRGWEPLGTSGNVQGSPGTITTFNYLFKRLTSTK